MAVRVSEEAAKVFRAVQARDADEVGWRLDEDPQLIHATVDGVWTLVMHAVAYGHLRVLKVLLERGADVNAVDDGGRSALWWAANQGHQDMVDVLLSHGADATRQNRAAVTPLIAAIDKGDLPIVQMLLPHYSVCDVNIRDALGRTALLAACQKDDRRIARALLLAGADTAIASNEGATAREVAASQGQQQCVALLNVRIPYYQNIMPQRCVTACHVMN